MSSDEVNTQRNFFQHLLKEPLLQFIGLGLLIFFASEWIESQRQTEAATIRIDANVQTYLANLYSAQFGYTPSPEILEQLIDNYVQEEVLFRDALQVGLAQQDEIIRRRLIQKMEYLILDSEIQAQAPAGALRNWYENHLQDYQLPARVTFKHHYFENRGEDGSAKQRALRALENTSSEIRGDRFSLNNEYSDLSPQEAAQLFGRNEFSEKLFTESTGRWLGPWQSGYGWHLVFIEHRTEARVKPFAEVKEQVFSAWQQHDQQNRFEQAIAERKKSYTVVREIRDINKDK